MAFLFGYIFRVAQQRDLEAIGAKLAEAFPDTAKLAACADIVDAVVAAATAPQQRSLEGMLRLRRARRRR